MYSDKKNVNMLEELMIRGSYLYALGEGVPGLTQTLCVSNMVMLQHMVDTAWLIQGNAQSVVAA